jgi:hypothetical protein
MPLDNELHDEPDPYMVYFISKVTLMLLIMTLLVTIASGVPFLIVFLLLGVI